MSYYLNVAIVLFFYVFFVFVISVIKKRNDVADIAWGLGFVLITWVSFFLAHQTSYRALLVGVLVSLWGLRLAWHIASRNAGLSEDYRYQAFRKSWVRYFYFRSFLQVFLLQGSFLYVIILPVLLINNNAGRDLGLLDGFGFVLWLVGFYFEVIGDAQLAIFIKNPDHKGQIMQGGLWQYSRHPNYFGEVCQWWALWIIALSVPGAWLSIVGPITITILILKVSGIPLLEQKMAKKPAFESYRQRVSMFFPWPPKKL